MAAIPLRTLEGKYEILEKLREGGMGAIYKVRHRLLDEVRVIKVMRPQLVQDEELKERFVREARLAIKLRHPNIAQLYDFTVDEDGTAYIVMELIVGMTLEEVLETTGPPPLGLALEVAQQSLRALGYLHSKGMIHRDISPDNLMLAEDTDGAPLVKLIDLGIAKSLAGGDGQRTATGMFLGKVRYAAPEQFGMDGAAPMSARGDLYSFGLVLYELLTGRYPIAGRDPNSIIAGHLFRQPLDFAESDPEGRIPPDLRKVVLSALAKSPGERPEGARALAQALAAFRSPSDVSRADLRRALSPSHSKTVPLPMRDPGSTQEHLDEQFGPASTPTPAPLPPALVTPAPATEPVRAREIAAELAKRQPTDRKRRLAIAATAAVLVVLVLATWLLSRRGAAPEPQETAAVAAGTLILDALPWGEVARIVDAQGREVPVEPRTYTPLALPLPPGRYTVTLTNPNYPQAITLEAEVTSGAPVRKLAELGRIDPDEFFKGLGW